MRSKYIGHCPICNADWKVGDQIRRLTGRWVHWGCKDEPKGVIRVTLPDFIQPP